MQTFHKITLSSVSKMKVSFVSSAGNCFRQNSKRMSTEQAEKSCKLLVIGGGTGGCTIAAKFASKLGKNNLIVVEPSELHYYQPMFTLIGGGMKKLKDSCRPMAEVLPKDAEWVKDSVQKLEPQGNFVVTQNGTRINYEYLVVAAGLKVDYTKIPGLLDGLMLPGSGVCSNYSPDHVEKTYEALENFEDGNLVFTFPNTPVKCAGAPQKICYIAEHYLRKTGKRGQARVIYNTAFGKLFGVDKYAESLWKVCRTRGIEVGLNMNLVEIHPERKNAFFEDVSKPDQPRTMIPYSMLHVTPPMGPPPFLRCSPMVCDSAGFLDVDKYTLRHKFFPNIFGIGDCTNTPTSKTAAAVAAQSGVVFDNLLLTMSDQTPKSQYNGYTSCPLVTSYNKCILAEFDYNLQPLETFPFDQSQESILMFHMKKDCMPILYWNMMLKGHWNGPEILRKLLHLDFKERSSAGATASN